MEKMLDIVMERKSVRTFDNRPLSDEHRKNRRKQQYVDYFIHIPNRFGMRALGMKRYNRLKRLFGRR